MHEPTKRELLTAPVIGIDIKKHDVRPLVDAMADMAFQARNLGRAARIYDMMLADKDCSVIVWMAGSLCSAGLREVFIDLVENRMVDAIVSTGANIVDQDFFEGLGFRHYKGDVRADDDLLRRNAIDRIYDTYIDEDQLRECDMTVAKIADEMLANGGAPDRVTALRPLPLGGGGGGREAGQRRPARCQLARLHPRDGCVAGEAPAELALDRARGLHDGRADLRAGL